MNEEELKELREYEKKVEIINEEKEKHRKALETELKKLQGQIQVPYYLEIFHYLYIQFRIFH